MKYIFSILCISVILYAFPLNEKTLMDISRTYGYYQGQLYTLNTIQKKYPDLANQVFVAKTKFNLSFGDVTQHVDLIMDKYPEWKSIKKSIVANTRKKINLDGLTHRQAVNFITAVEQRAKGKVESPVLETLLILKPDYKKNPEKEFYDGFKKRYQCNDFKKSKGVDFLIDIPMSWASKKANRPNIVRKFISNNGHGPAIAMVLVKNIPDGKTISESDIKNAMNKNDMETMLPPNAILKGYGFIKLEGLPGYWQRFTITVQRLKQKLTIETLSYTFFYKNKLIQIQFQVANLHNSKLNKIFQKYESLFDSIINSFVLTDVYRRLM